MLPNGSAEPRLRKPRFLIHILFACWLAMEQLQALLHQQNEAFQSVISQSMNAQNQTNAQIQQVVTNQSQQLESMQHQMANLSQAMTTMMTNQVAAAGATAPAASTHQASGDMEELKSIVHPGLLEKISTHDGEESSFPAWRLKFEGLCSLIGLEEKMNLSLNV